MDKFYGMDISEENQVKMLSIQHALPENVREFITDSDVQKLLNTNINELETQITSLFSGLGLNDGQQIRSACEKIKKIIHPSQTTEINNNNTSIYEGEFLKLIRDSIFSEAQVEVDDDFAKKLLKETDENIRKATLLSIDGIGRSHRLPNILKLIKEINCNYQTALEDQIKNMARSGINSETYATDPAIVEEVSNKFKETFSCEKNLLPDDVEQLLMSDVSKRKNVLSSILKKYGIKEKNSSSSVNFLSSIFQNNEQELDPSSSFLSYINNIIIEFYKSSNKKKGTTQTDKIFSDKAVDSIINYFKKEHKNYKYDQNDNAIDFANEISESEVMDNRISRFSLKQINKMLSSGVSPDCLLAIRNFDIYIKLTRKYLDDDIKNSCENLCREFIDFLYMHVDKRCMNKTNPENKATPTFTQNLISKYIKDKKLNSLEQIDKDPVIYSLFFRQDGSLRDKEQINKLLGSDEEIFEMFMAAKVNEMLLMNILNIQILWEFSDDWLNGIGSFDYLRIINFAVPQKKLLTFKLVDLLDNEDGKKNETLNNLLAEETVECDDGKFCLNQNQIAQTKAIRFIAQDLKMIESYLNPNKDKSKDLNKNDKNLNPNDEKNKACLKVLEKIFSHQFWFNNLADINFFTQLITFLKKEILVDELNEQDINEITTVDELKNILNKTTISHLFKNVRSDFVMSILLDSVLGDYLKIGNFTAQHFAKIFETVFEKVYKTNKNFDFKNFKKVFIETFVAKTKDMKRANFETQDNDKTVLNTVLNFVLGQIKQINQLLQEKNKEYIFEDDEIGYFNICLGIIKENKANLKEFSQDENVNGNYIYDPTQESMDGFVFDFLRGKFNSHEEITNQENKNTNQINGNDKNKDVQQESDPKKEEKNSSFINAADYLSDNEFDKLYGNNGTKSQHNKQNEENLKVENEEKIKTKTMKLKCIADLYNIDKDTVEDIINLDTGNLNVNKFFDELDGILNNNKHQSQKVKNQIKKCYIDQFFFGKTFTKIALMAHNKTQKYDDGKIIDFESNWKNYFNKLFDGNKVFDKKDVAYFWTIWEKRHAYFDKQISFAKIKFQIYKQTLAPDEEYEKQYSQSIVDAKKNHGLDEEILKSDSSVELNNNNLDTDIIKEIDSQVESLHVASFEIFFFGYLSVFKKTVTEVKVEFKKENLADFQKCYIQKFLTWHRNNKNTKSINKQFLLDMYFFFNRNDGKTQNIFGKEVVNYFNDCMIKLFKVNKTNIKFDKKLEPLKSSTLDEIQTVELDQKEKLGLWFLEYLDPERIARERRNKFNEAKKLILKSQNELKNQKKTKVSYFDPNKMKSRLVVSSEQNKEDKKIEKTNSYVNEIKINDETGSTHAENKIKHGEEINLNEKDDNQKNKEVNKGSINDKNLIEKKTKKIDQKVKRDDLNNKKLNTKNTNRNDITKINNINKEEKTNEKNGENSRININNEKAINQKKEVETLIRNEGQEEKIEIISNNQNPQENHSIEFKNDKSEKEIKYKDNQDEEIKNNIEDKSKISTDNKKREIEIKMEFHQNDLKINSGVNDNNISINNNEDKNKFEENNLIAQSDSMSIPSNFHFKIINNINSQQNNQIIKINCLSNYNIRNEHTEYMSILYGIDINIINEIDEAISDLRFPENFDFLSPLNQILNKYGKQKETQIKRYYIDRFFNSNIFKTYMQEEKFESMFNFLNQNVFDENNINYFWCQWKKTVLLHFDSQQFENQKLKANQNFCLATNYSPSAVHNISKDSVSQINSSVENFKYVEPEDFFRGYHILFKSENQGVLNENNELGVQKYYIECFLLHHMQQNTIDIKFLHHVDFRFRGYLLKKQTVFNDEAIKYFYALLEKLLLGNKENEENEIGKNEINDEINGLKIKNFEVNTRSFHPEKQKAEKNYRSCKIAFWVLLISAFLFGVASCFWVYFSALTFIAIAADVFCFKKVKDNKTKISSLIKLGRGLLSQNQISLYKQSVKTDVVCDEKIDYFAKIQNDKQKRLDEILKVRENMFGHEKE